MDSPPKETPIEATPTSSSQNANEVYKVNAKWTDKISTVIFDENHRSNAQTQGMRPSNINALSNHIQQNQNYSMVPNTYETQEDQTEKKDSTTNTTVSKKTRPPTDQTAHPTHESKISHTSTNDSQLA